MYLILCGAALSTLGVFMLSFSTQYWQIFLTQGLCIGLGCGMLFVPSMALIGRSFTKNRSLAVGFTTCGAPIGGIVYVILFEALLPKMGFAWAVRVLGFFMLGCYVISIPLLLLGAQNVKSLSSGTKRKLFDKAALTDGPFWSYSLICFTTFMAYLVMSIADSAISIKVLIRDRYLTSTCQRTHNRFLENHKHGRLIL